MSERNRPLRVCLCCSELRPHGARGYCTVCYKRQRDGGMPALERWKLAPELAGPPYRFGDLRLPRRFWTKVVEVPSGCWLWQGKHRDGYGRFWHEGRAVSAQGIAYAALVGEMPKGLVPDHTCHTRDALCPGGPTCAHRACVFPAHIEPVTFVENVLRGRGPSAQHAQKTHCPQDHPYDEANTYWYQGRRYCRTCQHSRGAQRH